MFRRSIHSVISLFLVGALAVVSGIPATQGDANGDQAIDVLDLQAVIAQVLEGTTDFAADANADGQVDVRDFQYLLKQVNTPASEQSQLPVEDEHRTLPTTPLLLPVGALVAVANQLTPPEEDADQAAFRAFDGSMRIAALRTERYVLNLSPHAPPQA